MTDSKQSETQPNIESLGPVPKDLAGFQNVTTGTVQFGDLEVWGAYRVKGWASDTIGFDIMDNGQIARPHTNETYRASVYRKIPVAKQGACDEAWKAVRRELDEKYVMQNPRTGEVSSFRDPRDITATEVDQVTPYFIPQDDARRKAAPMARGLLHYFPAALFEIAAHSLAADLKHNGENPDGPTWARGKSSDHEDCIVRHTIDAGKPGTPGRMYHLTARAWRALAALQEECEREGATPGVSSVFPK